MFLKNEKIIFKIKRSKVTDYAALSGRHVKVPKSNKGNNSAVLLFTTKCKSAYFLSKPKSIIIYFRGNSSISSFSRKQNTP